MFMNMLEVEKEELYFSRWRYVSELSWFLKNYIMYVVFGFSGYCMLDLTFRYYSGSVDYLYWDRCRYYVSVKSLVHVGLCSVFFNTLCLSVAPLMYGRSAVKIRFSLYSLVVSLGLNAFCETVLKETVFSSFLRFYIVYSIIFVIW